MSIDSKKTELLWGTPIYSVEFSNSAELLVQLSDLILEKEKELLASQDINDSLLFNKFSSLRDNQRLLLWKSECIEVFRSLINIHALAYLQENYPEHSSKFVIDAWANIHRFGDWHGSHSHYAGGREVASGVFWVQVPAEVLNDDSSGGKLVFFDPRGPFFHERKKVVITPTPGKLMIFPAWLQHEVTPLKCQGPRISIAFDVKKNGDY